MQYQERVVNEKAELDERAEKLRVFCQTSTFLKLDDVEQSRLTHQLAVMREYSVVLGLRIAAF